MNQNNLLETASFSPRSLQIPNAWVGHLSFASWVIQEISPKIFVELGTHSGNSYFSFCQSVVEAGISSKCYAVDTWQGDEHAGQYNDEIFANVYAHHQEHYAGFSRLLRMTFDDAASYFADESIELLHIDGLHTYEAVRHDFETWLPKLAPGAVVMFHDTNVRERNFGVWKLWEELQASYPNNLEFVHSHGLGVLQLNNAPDNKKLEWIQHSSPEKQRLVDYFAALGSRHLEHFELKQHATNLNQAVVERDGQITSLNHSLDECGGLIDRLNQIVADRGGLIDRLNQTVAVRDDQIASLNYQIEEILSSTSWRMTKSLRWIKRVVNRTQQHVQSLTMGRIARYVFRKLHLSTRVKNTIKDVAYQYAGGLFKEQPSYRMWKAIRRTEQTMFDGRQEGKFTSSLNITLELPVGAKNILVINDKTPTPDRDSGSLDVYFFMKAFIELGYNTTFIPDDLKPQGHYTDNLRSLGVRCLTHEDINSIESFLREEGCGFDVVLLYRVHTARMHAPNVRKYAPNAKIVFDTVDLHFLREERQAALDNSSEAQACARYTKEAEFEMMRVADATIVLSSVERDIIVEHDSSINVFTIPYMRDIPGCKSVYAERRDIVFIGGFLHLPNVDSINYFVNEIWPIVSAALPDAKFIILGSSPPDEILVLGDIDPRIQVVGFVEEIDPYFNTCRISIAPIRYGAGIKGKIGTSASYGVPCVASSLAVEGMGLIDGVDVLVADTAEMFAEKVIKLYSDETLWKQLSNSSLDFMQRNYSYKVGKKRLQRLLNSLDVGLRNNEILEFTEIESLTEYQSYKLRRRDEYIHRAAQEHASIGDARGFALEGYCAVCHKPTTFHADYEDALHDAEGNKQVNWRERMVCRSCELNNRVRAALHLFKQECAPPQNSDIYVTEQTTPLFAWVKNHYSSVFGSEFLGSERLPTEINTAGIRHESLTGLSFADKTFDFILSFDVLEHIPDYQMAIQECSRVLRPGGQMLFSVPFCFDSNEHIVRARINDDGSVENLMEPEYPGDPVNVAGCLCFYHFGWRLLDEFREAGFDSVKALFYWSDKFGYLGFDQALFIATKRDEMAHP